MTSNLSRRGCVGVALVSAVAAAPARGAAPLHRQPTLYTRDAREFGADPTGRADSTTAFLAAAAAGPFVVSDGAYILSGRVVIGAHCAMNAAARIGGTATVTFDAGFSAPIAHVFGSGLTVTFNPAFAPEGHPEWWGALGNTPTCDCEPALSACIAACPVTRLQPADYWIARTWKLTTNWRTIIGVGMNGAGGNPATRIVTADPAIDIIQIGPDDQPANIADFVHGVALTNLTVLRSVAPSLPAAGGDYRSGASGVRLQYVLQSSIERVGSNESINGFYVKACVATYLDHTHAARTLPAHGGGAGADRYFGYFLDATGNMTFAIGNASVYLDFFSSSCANIPTDAFVYAHGGFTDLFFNRGECSGHANGMSMNGGGKTDEHFSAEDCHIHHVIMDGLSGDGILINQANSGSAVTISQCYAANGSGVAVHVVNCLGAVSVTGCQFLGTPHSTGLMVEGGSGVTSVNNIFSNFGAAMVWKNSSVCESVGDTIQNFSAAGSVAGTVQLISSVRCTWRGKVKGFPGAMHAAVALTIQGPRSGPCDYNLIDCSGIDPGCLEGGAANKLIIAGIPVTDVGITASAPTGYSNNVVAGVMN